MLSGKFFYVKSHFREELVTVLNQLKSGPTVVREGNAENKSPSEPMEDEDEDSMQDYANVIRDTGPVPESNTTSVQNSDDESSITTGERSKFKISAASSKATSREVTPLRDNSPSPNKNTTHIGGGSNESKSEALKTVEGWSTSKSPTPPQPSSKNDLNVKENVDKKSEENKESSSKTDSKIELETKDFTNNKKVSNS